MTVVTDVVTVTSLNEFVVARGPRRSRRCAVCMLPDEVRAQMRAARASEITYRDMADWVATLFPDDEKAPSRDSIASHFQRDHD